MKLQIAGLPFLIEGHGEYFKQRAEEYMLPLDSEGEHFFPIEIRIHRTDRISYPGCEKAPENPETWLMANDREHMIYKVLPTMPEEVYAMVDFEENSAEISILELEKIPKDRRDFYYSGMALEELMLPQRRMVFHSSCIQTGGKAIAFSAPSGIGKSTHAGLWQRYVPDTVIINDDTPVFRFDKEDAVYACGSPWSGKTQQNSNCEAPLSAIVMLRRGKINAMRELKGMEAFARLMGQARMLPFKASMNQVSDLCEELLSRVPIYELTCDISEDAVRVVKEMLKL